MGPQPINWEKIQHVCSPFPGKCSMSDPSVGTINKTQTTSSETKLATGAKQTWASLSTRPHYFLKNNLVRQTRTNLYAWSQHGLGDALEYACGSCTFRCINQTVMEIHEGIRHSRRTRVFSCGKCQYRTRFTNNIRRHRWVHHGEGTGKWFPCDKCSFNCKSANRLSIHQRVRHLTH